MVLWVFWCGSMGMFWYGCMSMFWCGCTSIFWGGSIRSFGVVLLVCFGVVLWVCFDVVLWVCFGVDILLLLYENVWCFSPNSCDRSNNSYDKSKNPDESKEASFWNDRKMVLSEIAERRFFLKERSFWNGSSHTRHTYMTAARILINQKNRCRSRRIVRAI